MDTWISEFEELEGVSSMSVMETLIEPSPTAPAIDSPEDSTAFMNFFNVRFLIYDFSIDSTRARKHVTDADACCLAF